MTNGNKPPPIPDPPFSPLAIPAIVGTFAYRFNGYAVTQDKPFYLLGIGQLSIDSSGKITGDHQSSSTALQGQDATVMTGEYTLTGQMTLQSNGGGGAAILFQKKSGQGLDVLGEFFVRLAGNVDQFWMMSSKALAVNSKEGEIIGEAVELASLEAVRLALPKP
ncbi:MAG: hypothetical protein AB7I59_30430 [Geminicoccaceae bacterium]|uniref:hypothetical protein n=1 Tax=Reyranella sp. TaxID=1929291 RepID=UPI003D13645A